MIADFAIAHDTDGKLYVTGGGLRSLRFQSFPAGYPRLSLAIGLELDEGDKGTPHVIRIHVSGPTPEPIIKAQELTINAPASAQAPLYANFVFNADRVVFPSSGDYGFDIAIDGKTAVTVPLRVEALAGPPPLSVQAAELLLRAYTEFNAGDTRASTATLRDVTKRFPNDPNGWNNLGFVMLASGQSVQEAREVLLRAVELKFSRPEIAEANLGCAEYLAGSYAAALALFEGCIRERGFAGSAVLCGIDDDALFTVSLTSAADYSALMHLDAGWSALRLGTTDRAAHFLEGCQSAELAARDSPGGTRFSAAVAALRAAIRA
jgi:tetratricopeptide (TPR) repeat protein